jgi:spermidine synthase
MSFKWCCPPDVGGRETRWGIDVNGKRIVRETNLILGGFLLSGAAALIYEVAWTRALSLVLGSTVYALSTMLATFMGGLALGAFLFGKYCDRRTDLLFAFGLCELGIGISGLLSIPIIYRLPALYLFVFQTFHAYATLFFVLQVLLCVLVMLVPTLLMGATFPIVSRRITRSMEEMGTKVGKAYSLNTLGAVAGSLTAGFLLIPELGVGGTVIAAALLNAAIALSMLSLSEQKVLKPLLIALPLLALSAVWAGISEPKAYLINFHTVQRKPIEDVVKNMGKYNVRQVFHEDSAHGEVRAFKTEDGELLLQVGGKLEGTGFGDLPNTLLLAYLPIAMHPKAESFLTIGLGAGITLAAAKDAVDDVDLVEVNPGVINAVRLHGLPEILDGVEIIRSDARNYLLRTGKKYDVISSHPSYPTESMVSNLFTREFFEIALRRLNTHGILCQWLPYGMLKQEGVDMMIKTFGSVFPYTHAWRVDTTRDILLTGSRDFIPFSLKEIASRIKKLSPSNLPVGYSLIMSPSEVHEIVHSTHVPVNTDDQPLLEFKAVNNMLEQAPR